MKLGNLIEKFTTYTGIRWLVKLIWGDNCGCDKRKEKLNEIEINLWDQIKEVKNISQIKRLGKKQGQE